MVRKLRLQRGWSQEQLAQLSGLSIRTIQRIEGGQKPGLDSLKALAVVFELPISALQGEPKMSATAQEPDTHENQEEQQTLEQIRAEKGFYQHALRYVLVIGLLFAINLLSDSAYIWAVWPMLGWGIGLLTHGCKVFIRTDHLFGAAWERRQLTKRLGRVPAQKD